MTRQEPSILGFDIEASGLNADFGIMLCFGSKFVGRGRVEVLNILDYPGLDLIKKERNLLIDVSKRLLSADIWLGHYSQRFDVPFINTRLLYHRLPTLPAASAHIDTWKISRNHLKLRSNRLATISTFLGTEEEKNAIKPEEWIRALGGHRPSMGYIVEHCRRDIMVLEEAYLRLRPLAVDHPNRGILAKGGACPGCGSKDLQKRGMHITRTRQFQRYQCQKCGGWSRSLTAERVGEVR